MRAEKTIFTAEYRKIIGWLTAERKYQGINQSVLAESLGFVNHSVVSKVERFDRRLDIHEYVLWCEALNIDPCEGIKLISSKKP